MASPDASKYIVYLKASQKCAFELPDISLEWAIGLVGGHFGREGTTVQSPSDWWSND